jgi:hypothetical protein
MAPPSPGRGEFCESKQWLVQTPKMLQLCTNQLVVWFVQICVNDYVFVIILSPIPEL